LPLVVPPLVPTQDTEVRPTAGLFVVTALAEIVPGVGLAPPVAGQQSQWAFSVQAKILPFLEDESLHS
jgi:hypothetical protein